jgi:hypothetical protein
MTRRDPDGMTADDRWSEVAFLLGVACLRLLLARRNPLDPRRSPEALCVVLTGGNPAPRKEAS